jgi:hypothetical protein
MDSIAHWGLGKTRDILFDPGTLRWSSAALLALQEEESHRDPKDTGTPYVLRHLNGDFGDPAWRRGSQEWNQRALHTQEGALLSVYTTPGGHRILVLTTFSERLTLVMTFEDTKDYDKVLGKMDIHIESP